jgi:hypothetical protein
MSKVDAMRALKQARLEQLRATAPARPAAARPAVSAPPRAVEVAVVPDGACGHRNMSGRSCTRPGGHSEKSHRYG